MSSVRLQVSAGTGEGSEQRRGVERRHTPYLLSDWRHAFGGRRRGSRRDTDQRSSVHVDWYPWPLLVCALALLGLSALDATLTLHLMTHGVVEEANPFMAPLLAHDVRLFVGVKLLITAVGAVALVVYGRLHLFGRVPMRRIGWWLAFSYSLLVGYELLLVRFAVV